MLIPGILISIVTFPGVIIHELAHKIFCELFGVKVHKVCYFRFKSPCGYVIHERPQKFSQIFFITVGSFIVNTLTAILVFILARMSGETGILLWLGLSIGMHSFPSKGDAKTLWGESNRHIKDDFLAVIGYPFAILIWLSSILSIIWFDLIYAVSLYYLVRFFL